LKRAGPTPRERLHRVVRWLRIPANAASSALLVALLVIAGRHCRTFLPNTIDDAFITFRYADNLAHGRGLVFNPGERVEGTSTFLETCALALARVLGADIVDASRVIGVASYGALIVGAFALVRSVTPSYGRVLGLGAASLVASSMSLALYAMSGLETTLFAALLFLGVALHLRAARAPSLGTKAWSLAMGAAALTRPEGVGYFLLLWGCAVLRDVTLDFSYRDVAKRAVRSVGWFATLYVPILFFRVVYFHALVPNTVTAKSHFLATFHGKSVQQVVDALTAGAAAHHAAEYAAILGVAVYLIPAGLLRQTTRYPTFVLLLMSAASLAVDALDDGDWMPGWRLLTPAVAPIAVAIALGLGALLFRSDQRLLRTQLPSLLIAIAVLEPAAVRLYPGGWTPSSMDDYRVSLGKKLASVRRDDDLMATDMAGIVPYYSGMRTIDMNGLCDREIALHGLPYGPMGKIDRPYVIGRKPTFFQPNFVGEMHALWDDPAFAPMKGDYYAVITDEYRKGAGIRDRKLLVVRKDRPQEKELIAALGGPQLVQLVDLAQQLKAER